jgi:hypothetical protein
VSYLLRNDDVYTVRVSWTEKRTYLCEVHHAGDRLVHHEFEHAQECLDLAAQFVEHHVSSIYLWSLINDSTSPPLVKPMPAAYTQRCRQLVADLYARAAR